MIKTCLVTGGEGFLGKSIIKRLRQEGWEVYSLDFIKTTTRYDYIECDLNDFNRLRKVFPKVCVVIHSAAMQMHSPNRPRYFIRSAFLKNNYEVTRNFINLCVNNGVKKFIYVSSDMTYGFPKNLPIKETALAIPLGPYGESKLKAEKYVLNLSKKINVLVFRPRLIVGKGRGGVIASLFRFIKSGLPVFLIGNGKNKYQIIDVEDCTDAIIKGAESNLSGEIFNVGSDHVPSMREIIIEIARREKLKLTIVPLPSFLIKKAFTVLSLLGLSPLQKEQFAIADKDYILDCSKAKCLLGWKPKANTFDSFYAAYKSMK